MAVVAGAALPLQPTNNSATKTRQPAASARSTTSLVVPSIAPQIATFMRWSIACSGGCLAVRHHSRVEVALMLVA